MPARDQRLLAFAAIATSALVVVLALAGHPELLAYASPLLVLALPLVAGRYVGEEKLARMRERAATSAPGGKPALAAFTGRRVPALTPRGARLIAHALAERGPPTPALT